MTVTDHFPGLWRLNRTLIDRRAGVQAQFAGQAQITRDGGAFIYDESGAWVDAPWGALAGKRRDRWDIGDEVRVYFDHGGFFHAFTPVIRGQVAVHHLCGRDDYAGRYDFALPDQWKLEWTVTGPAKNYRMITRYSR